MFTLFDITEIKETTLGANQLLSDAQQKLQWNTASNVTDKKFATQSSDTLVVENSVIVLNPMEIRTFIITYAAKVEDDNGGSGGNDEDEDDDENDDDDDDDDSSSSTNRAAVLLVLFAAVRNFFLN